MFSKSSFPVPFDPLFFAPCLTHCCCLMSMTKTALRLMFSLGYNYNHYYRLWQFPSLQLKPEPIRLHHRLMMSQMNQSMISHHDQLLLVRWFRPEFQYYYYYRNERSSIIAQFEARQIQNRAILSSRQQWCDWEKTKAALLAIYDGAKHMQFFLWLIFLE